MLEIYTLVVTPFQQNCRLLLDTESRALVVVDPGGDIPQILTSIKNLKPSSTDIWLTHAHIDHAGGVRALKGMTGARLFAGEVEQAMRASIEDQAEMYGLSPQEYENCPEPEVYLKEGDEVEVGIFRGKVLFTPGHSPGHLSFFFPTESMLIAGDTLFDGSVGRTDIPGGDFELLSKSIRNKLYTLPNETLVMSGHGPDTTIGKEKRNNPFVKG